MAPAVDGVDAVRERVDGLVEAPAVLQGHLDERVAALVVDVDGVGVQRPAAAVEVAHVGVDTGVEVERLLARPDVRRVRGVPGALVVERNPDAAGEVRHLAEAGGEGVELVVERLEDVLVGHEGDGGTGVVGLLAAHLRELRGGDAALVGLAVKSALDGNLHLKRTGQRVDHRGADAVQAAGDLVAATAELAAGVQRGEHRLDAGEAGLLVLVDGDAAPVVLDAHAAVGADRHVDAVAEAGHGLVDGVVDDLVDEVVQPALVGGADVHAGPAAHGLEALEDLDLLGGVGGVGGAVGRALAVAALAAAVGARAVAVGGAPRGAASCSARPGHQSVTGSVIGRTLSCDGCAERCCASCRRGAAASSSIALNT